MSPRQRQVPVFLVTLLVASLSLWSLPARAQSNPVSTILFGSMDAGRSAFLTTGAKIALDDVNREGFVTLVSAGGGVRQERGTSTLGTPAPNFLRTTLTGAALGGYQFFYDWGVMALFAGPEGAMETLDGPRSLRALASRFGLRLQGEVWMRTSPNTLATVTLIIGSAHCDAYARASAGFKLWGGYLGPEIAYYGDRTGYQKLSAGLHATDFSLGPFSLRVGTGLLYETETARLGPYVALAVWAPLSWTP